MPASLSKSLSLSSTLKKMDEEAAAIKVTGNKQGIVSILGSDCERTKAASLRRTLSADMSSKKWLEQQGFSPMKKIASVDEIFPLLSSSSYSSSSSSSSSDGEEEDYRESRRGQLEIWSSIQEEEKKKKKELENPEQFDIWTSILSQKAEDSSKSGTIDPAAAPYIHPLVKRASSLSEKSLEICTENLGSETGSDGFSSYPPSETSDLDQEEEQDQQQQQQQQEKEELQVPKYSKKVQPRSFPPPLPSLTRGDGPSLRMQSHRKNGRLVLEAVSVPTQNYFSAQRQDGRLLLTFVNSTTTSAEQDQPKDYQEIVEDNKEEMGEWSDDDEEFEEPDDEEEEEEEEDQQVEDEDEVENIEKESIIIGKMEMEIGVVDQQQTTPKVTRTEVINVHRAAVMMNKLIRLANRNPTWPKRINEVIKFEDHDATQQLSKSFPMPPRGMVMPRPIPSSSPSATAAAATFNVYENCWRSKQPNTHFSTPPLLPKPSPLKNNNNNNNNNHMPIFSRTRSTSTTTLKANDQQQQLLGMRAGDKADYLVPCKEPRRSLLFWEPHCIATS